MPETQRRHRLFVAVPIVALCVTWSTIATVRSLASASYSYAPGTIVRAEHGEIIVPMPDGLIRLEEGAVLEMTQPEPVLVRGSALVLADDSFTLRIGDALTSGWAGGFFVSVHMDAINIAALTTPVRIDHLSGTVILPPRMQIPSLYHPTIVALPRHFLSAKLPVLTMLSQQLSPSSAVSQNHRVRAALATVRLPAARMRAEAAADALQCGLRMERDASRGAMLPMLQSCIATVEDWLLLSFHLSVRTAVWSLPHPEAATLENRLQRVELLPISDRAASAVPDRIVSWWAQEVLQLHHASGALLQERLPAIVEHIALLSRDGYPDRAKRYASKLLALEQADVVLPFAVQSMLRSTQTHATPRVLAFASSVLSVPPSSSVSSGATAPIDADMLLESADASLRSSGFMFSGRTQFQLQGTIVTVRDIVLGTPTGHVVLHFSYDPARDVVSRIEMHGKLLPYELPLARFVDWVRTQRNVQ